ncbi:MAG: hypothetical protein IKY90_01265 [Oscillospiraceae bacterium]|nr:hypothetical protein [Oscillospiraceae bacterium]
MFKKLLLPLLMIIALSGCATTEYDWVIKIDEKSIQPDEFVAAQMYAYIESQTIADEDRDVSQWINDHAVEKLKRDIFIESEFNKRNLAFGQQADEFIRIFGEEGWENVARLYENNKLDKEQYFNYLTSLYKEQLVFNAIYLYDEQNKVNDKEIEEYLNENLSRLSFFRIARVNDDGTPIDEQQEQQLDSIVAAAVDSINNGENIAEVATHSLTQSAQLLGSEADFSDGEAFVTTEYISKASVDLLLDFMENFFIVPIGQCVSYELEDCYYICQKIELCDTQVEYMYLKQDVVNLIRDAEFEKMITDVTQQMAVEYHPEAVRFYSPERLKMNID